MANQFLQKIRARWTLHTQLLFTLLAFAAMVVLSYFFMSTIVRGNLVRNAGNILAYTEERVTASLIEPRTTLTDLSVTMGCMISRGDSSDMLRHYIDTVSEHLLAGGEHSLGFRGLYGYFETLPEGPVFMHSAGWLPPDNYRPREQPWYRLAVEAGGTIVETIPRIDDSGKTVFTYAVSVLENGKCLGVVCFDVPINRIGDDVVNTALNRGGYGMLINQELFMLAHPQKDFVGRNLRDPAIPLSIFVDELVSGADISERPMMSFKGEASIAFIKRLPNGWYLGLVTPEAQYYRTMRYMAIILSVLGALFAAVLMIVVIRIDAARNKSDAESRQKSTFLANMSHEIRTPINAIVGMTAIGKSAPNSERKDYCFTKIDDASQHLLGVINDILDMSKIEADKFELSPVEFNFDAIIKRVVNVISFRMEEKRQKFDISVDEKIPAVLLGDDQRLVQVIINLLSNAVKFTPDGGSIRLDASLRSEEDGVCIVVVEISDTGIGIAPEHQAKLFRSFEQADSGTSRKFGGTGLGLVISKRIVEIMGGTISVSSAPGKGSKFTFSFRAARGAEVTDSLPAGLGEDTPVPGEFSGRCILLAEDIEINREIILAYMEETGAEIDCAGNGIEVLKKFDENPGKYDLVFMDVQMPEMDGLEATRLLRGRGVTVPIIAMTANVFKEDIESCLAAGMNDHLGKPLGMTDVLEMARVYLSN